MLIKQAEKVRDGKILDDFFSYMANTKQLLSTPSGATTVEEFINTDHIKRMLATRSVYLV